MEGGCSLLGSMQIKQSAAQSPDAGRKPGGGMGAWGGGGWGGGGLLGSNHHVQIKHGSGCKLLEGSQKPMGWGVGLLQLGS